MKTLSLFLASFFWFGMFLALFFGFEPTKITIGISFLALFFTFFLDALNALID